MLYPRHIIGCKQCSGFTLLELLIAITISTIILLGISTVLIISANNRNQAVGLQQLQKEAITASQILKLQLSQIGYRSVNDSLVASNTVPVKALDKEFPEVVGNWSVGQILKADAVANSLAFRFGGASDTDGNPDGSIRTCLGDLVGEGEKLVRK